MHIYASRCFLALRRALRYRCIHIYTPLYIYIYTPLDSSHVPAGRHRHRHQLCHPAGLAGFPNLQQWCTLKLAGQHMGSSVVAALAGEKRAWSCHHQCLAAGREVTPNSPQRRRLQIAEGQCRTTPSWEGNAAAAASSPHTEENHGAVRSSRHTPHHVYRVVVRVDAGPMIRSRHRRVQRRRKRPSTFIAHSRIRTRGR